MKYYQVNDNTNEVFGILENSEGDIVLPAFGTSVVGETIVANVKEALISAGNLPEGATDQQAFEMTGYVWAIEDA